MGAKRKRAVKEAHQQAANAAPTATSTPEAGNGDDQLTEYERQRLRIIARNRERLRELGIEEAVRDLDAVAAPKQRAKPRPRARAAQGAPHAAPSAPARRSARLEQAAHGAGGGGAAGGAGGARAEQLVELRDEEPAPKRRVSHKPGRSDAEKLAELAVAGVVEITAEHAKFIVLGSSGKNYYTVTLSDDKQTCTCMDFRCRRRRCKHQKLVLQQLRIPDDPGQWHKAVEERMGELPGSPSHSGGSEEGGHSSRPIEASPPVAGVPAGHSEAQALAFKFM